MLITLCVFLKVTGRSNKMIFPPLIIMLCVTFTALVQRFLAMVKAISAAASTAIPAGETTWGAVFIANGLQLILAVLLIVLGLTIVIHSFKSYAKSERNSDSPYNKNGFKKRSRKTIEKPGCSLKLPTHKDNISNYRSSSIEKATDSELFRVSGFSLKTRLHSGTIYVYKRNFS